MKRSLTLICCSLTVGLCVYIPLRVIGTALTVMVDQAAYQTPCPPAR